MSINLFEEFEKLRGSSSKKILKEAEEPKLASRDALSRALDRFITSIDYGYTMNLMIPSGAGALAKCKSFMNSVNRGVTIVSFDSSDKLNSDADRRSYYNKIKSESNNGDYVVIIDARSGLDRSLEFLLLDLADDEDLSIILIAPKDIDLDDAIKARFSILNI